MFQHFTLSDSSDCLDTPCVISLLVGSYFKRRVSDICLLARHQMTIFCSKSLINPFWVHLSVYCDRIILADTHLCFSPNFTRDWYPYLHALRLVLVSGTAPAQYQRPCTSGADVRESHRENCAKYYECGVIRLAGIMDPTLMECPYPLLFNDETTRCEFPESVKCNGRNEPTDPCKYIAFCKNMFPSMHFKVRMS